MLRPRVFLPALSAFLLLLAPVRAGFVLTMNGEMVRGEVEWQGRNVVAKPAGGGSSRPFPLDNIWIADFRNPENRFAAGFFDPLKSVGNHNYREAGVLFVNGSFLAGVVESIDLEKGELELRPEFGDRRTFRLDRVARININPTDAGVSARAPQGMTGVIMANGNFVEGQILEASPQSVRVDSILSGRFTVDRRNQLHAIVLSDFYPISTDYIILTRKGTRLFANTINPMGGTVEVNDAVIGRVTLPVSEIARFSVGQRRTRDLTTLPYIRRASMTGPEQDFVVRSARPTVTPLVVDPVARLITMPAGNAMAVQPPEGARGFVARIGVPESVAEEQKVMFQVRVDNRIVFQSKPMGRESPVEVVSIRQPIRHYLVLEVLPVGHRTHEAPGLWIDPVLIRE